MNSPSFQLAGPFTHRNLLIFLIEGEETLPGAPVETLADALATQRLRVHETGAVGEIQIENLMEDKDVFVQAGDMVKGGRQDRTFAVDFVVPAKSGRIGIPSFFSQNRWNGRAVTRS
ncbi:MAG: hypothetical protein HY360_21065 [Verrucomicrobia bacterium]|nr:hypothetical protein [Verrucomicrobiota bacterium]